MGRKNKRVSKGTARNIVVTCPMCNRKSQQAPTGRYWCRWCEAMFDDDPLEGGDYSDRNPSARIERQERSRRK